MGLERFIDRWTIPTYLPTPVDERAIADVEALMCVRFPTDYRVAVLRSGLPRPTSALLDSIVDNNLSLADVSEFLDPASIVATSRSWRDSGLPNHLVAFATDCMGNLFCFSNQSRDSASGVFYFNHDENSVNKVASSFTAWIDELASVPAT